MKTVGFVIKKTSSRKDKTFPIYIRYNYTREKRTLLNTGKYILAKYWNYDINKLRKNHPEYKEYSSFIDSLRMKVERIVEDALIKEIEPTVDYVRSIFDTDIIFNDKDKKKDFFSHLESFIEGSKMRVSKDVIKDYNSLKKHLTNFQKDKKVQLTFNTITYENYVKLREYLIYDAIKPDKTKGLSINTVGKQIKNLKAFMRDCIKRGITDYKDLSFLKVETEEVDSIYLNEEEIKTIYEVDLSELPQLEKYRDLFIIGCETGLRFSDFSKLRSGHIKGDFIRKKVAKTHKSIVIPISPLLREVLDKYHNNPPQDITLQKFNKNIKKVGKKAELFEEIITVKKVGIKKEETTNQKYELISSHTCRRSFCTNQFNRGMPTLLIRKISGHKTEAAFLRYIKIDEEDAAKKMLELWKS
jgi:integrase